MHPRSFLRRLLPILVVGLVLVGLPARVAAESGWVTNGVFTNPAANTILAESPTTVVDGSLAAIVLLSCEVSCIVALELRDAANAVTEFSHVFLVPTTDTKGPFDFFRFPTVPGQRTRLRLVSAITGRIQGSLYYDF